MGNDSGPGLIGTLPLRGRRLIEASAGTGKTYTLAGLYLRLVLGVDCKRRTPPEILVLTFTRAATRELRDRIRERLIEAARAFREGKTEDELLGWFLEQFESRDHLACARLLDVAASWMDEAAIHTIHAWCQTVLRQHAFDSGSLFEQEMGENAPNLLGEAVEDYWRDHVVIDHPLADELVSKLDSPESFKKIVQELLAPDVEIRAAGQPIDDAGPPDRALAALVEWTEKQRKSLEPVRVRWNQESDQIKGALESSFKAGHLNGRTIKSESLTKWIDAIDYWVHKRSAPPWSELGKFRADWLKGSGTKKNAPAPDHDWFNDVQKALEAIEGLGPEPDWLPSVLAHAATDVLRRVEAAKQRSNVLNYDDLIVNLNCALAGPSGARLRETLIEEFPVAMVDEFQDTDPVQYRIFDRIWGACDKDDPDNALLLIGDPKQSIYGFRGADVHAYMQARETVHSRHTLDRNYRSTKRMVAAVNWLFSAGERHPAGAFAFPSPGEERAMPFEDVDAHGQGEVLWIDGKEATPLTLWFAPETEGKKKIGADEYRLIMARQAAESVARLLELARSGRAEFRADGEEAHAVRPSDIAILVPSRLEANPVRTELQRRGLPSVYLSARDSIFGSDEAGELVPLLSALADPDNERLLRSAFASRLLARTTQELDRLNRDEQQLELEFERFRALQALWQEKGVLTMIRRLLDDYELSARLLADPARGERAVTNLLHLAELLQERSQAVDGEHALVRWLADKVDQDDRDGTDEQILRLESDAGLVRVVTSHSSKGLEYPLVFAPFVCAYKQEKKKGLVRFHDGHAQVMDLDPDETARAVARDELRQEALRLFYVTVTRAKHACWLGFGPFMPGNNSGPPDLEAFPPGHLLLGLAKDPESPEAMRTLIDRLAEQAAGDIAVVEVDDAPGCTRIEMDGPAQLEDARVYRGAPRAPWWVASYSALQHATGPLQNVAPEPRDASEDQALEEAEALPGADDDTDSPMRTPEMDRHGFPRGARPGTFLHGLLEWAGLQGMDRTRADPSVWFEQIEARCHRRSWDAWTEVVQAWMLELLEQPMALEGRRVRLGDLERGRTTPELEFWFEATGVQTGELDRLVSRQTMDSAPRPELLPNRLNGMMRGFIDLVFEHEGRYYVLDYKSNHLGDRPEAYSIDAMRNSVLEKRYDLQFALYTLALHRLLKSRLPDYDYDRHVGGAVYLYLRGCGSETGGIFHERPDRTLIEAMDRRFRGSSSDLEAGAEAADES